VIRRPAVALALTAAAVSLAGCGSGGSGGSGDAVLPLNVPLHVSVDVRHVDGLGDVLVDGQGRTLYMFPPDAGRGVTCTGACAGTWPPLVIADSRTPTAGAGVIKSDLGTVADPNTGARVVTYAGYPLYRYAGDVAAGTANGQALFLNGGPWYVVDPDGQPVTTDPGARS
jgi:predicted lipoprotein with Yx(FWY)xxD motif